MPPQKCQISAKYFPGTLPVALSLGYRYFITVSFPALPAVCLLSQAGNATVSLSTDIAMDVVAGEVPFEFLIEGLEQDSSEPAGFDVRVSALNGAGYGPPSMSFNIKVTTEGLSSPG